jgi:hypothetical protein
VASAAPKLSLLTTDGDTHLDSGKESLSSAFASVFSKLVVGCLHQASEVHFAGSSAMGQVDRRPIPPVCSPEGSASPCHESRYAHRRVLVDAQYERAMERHATGELRLESCELPPEQLPPESPPATPPSLRLWQCLPTQRKPEGPMDEFLSFPNDWPAAADDDELHRGPTPHC